MKYRCNDEAAGKHNITQVEARDDQWWLNAIERDEEGANRNPDSPPVDLQL